MGLQAQNKMYGMTERGGSSNTGVIYSINSDGTNQQKLYDFELAEGRYAYGGLVQASNGKMYGTAQSSQHDNVVSGLVHVLFEYDPSTGQYKKAANVHRSGCTLLEASDGHLYGVSFRGGTSNVGTIYRYDLTMGSLTILADLADASITGSFVGQLTKVSGKLYGATDAGELFEYDLSSQTLTEKVPDLSGNQLSGSLMVGSDDLLYGVAQYGGTNNFGLIYSYDPVTNNTAEVLDFGADTDGLYARGYSILAGNFIYGGTLLGGSNGYGILYQYDYVNDVFTKLVDFDGTNGNQFDNIMLATNGKLYGNTVQGGTNEAGSLFEYDLSTSTFTVLRQYFSHEGSSYYNSLIEGSDGILYGVKYGGTSTSEGGIYSYNISDGAFTNLVYLNDAINGHTPRSSFVEMDGKLYGTTALGGALDQGVLFEFDPATDTYTKLADFMDGDQSMGDLVNVSGTIYGTTRLGGINDLGTIFKYDGENLETIFSFGSENGGEPIGGLVPTSSGYLFGVTRFGGTANKGILYQLDPSNDSFQKFVDFDEPSGSTPMGELSEDYNGILYGTTRYGGQHGKGTLYSFDPDSHQKTKLFDFDNDTGYQPVMGIELAFNGKFYGVTQKSGTTTENVGTLFEFNPYTHEFQKIIDFSEEICRNIGAPLTLSSNGNLIGTARSGGADEVGAIFEFNPYSHEFNVTHHFDILGGANTNRNGFAEVFESNVPSITIQPVTSTQICQGEALELFVAASGPDLAYQWKKGSENIAGANSSYFRIENVSESQDGNYSCVVTNSHGSVTSETASVSITIIPMLTLEEISTKTYGDPSFTLDFTTEGANNLNFTSSNLEVATITEGTVTIVGGGTATITGILSNSCFTTTAEQTLVVNKATHEVTFAAIPEATYGDADITLSASSSAGVPVTFSSSDENVATISGKTLTIVGGGTATITVSSENSNYALATSTQPLTVKKADQSITFETLEEPLAGGIYPLHAAASSELEVTYTSSNADIASIDGQRIHVHDLGEVVVTAHQDGNNNYNSTSTQQTLVISKVLVLSGLTSGSIFPNPANEYLTVKGLSSKVTSIDIYDLNGQVMYHLNPDHEQQFRLDVSSYPTGLYLMKITEAQKVHLHKFYKTEKE